MRKAGDPLIPRFSLADMHLVVISHKDCWPDPAAPPRYVTTGGFPRQMAALAGLFDRTTLFLPCGVGPPPPGASPLKGHELGVVLLGSLPGRGWRRKAAMLAWAPRHLPRLWSAVRLADAVHTPVPGDVGLIGLLIALVQGKALFVRYCTQWGQPRTPVGLFLTWLLERTAGNQIVVMATGGAAQPPSRANPAIEWIFSTSLSGIEWQALQPAAPWRRGQPPRLIAVGRLEPVKNLPALLEALADLRREYPGIHLDLVGEGSSRPALEKRCQELGLGAAVTFHGNVAHGQVLALLAQAHLFVLPSHLEGFPKVVLEAMACGLPVVATAVSVMPELLGERHGWLVERPTPAALAGAVRQVLADEAALEARATAARAASQGYTLETWGATIGARLAARWEMPLRSGGSPQKAEPAQKAVSGRAESS